MKWGLIHSRQWSDATLKGKLVSERGAWSCLRRLNSLHFKQLSYLRWKISFSLGHTRIHAHTNSNRKKNAAWGVYCTILSVSCLHSVLKQTTKSHPTSCILLCLHRGTSPPKPTSSQIVISETTPLVNFSTVPHLFSLLFLSVQCQTVKRVCFSAVVISCGDVSYVSFLSQRWLRTVRNHILARCFLHTGWRTR